MATAFAKFSRLRSGEEEHFRERLEIILELKVECHGASHAGPLEKVEVRFAAIDPVPAVRSARI